jgi:hypothetical protein
MNPAQFWGGAAAPYEIEQSLRFNSADSAYLNRTPGSAGNRKTWTFSCWLKLASLTQGERNILFGPAGVGGYGGVTIYQNNGLRFAHAWDPAGTDYIRQTAAVFRDPSAWYHVVYWCDTTQSGTRWKIYVNGVEQTLETPSGNNGEPSQNTDLPINSTNAHYLGGNPTYGYFSGYLAEVNFIDGSALDPEDFGEFDDNGVWRPIKYAGSYTGNSFYLKFASGDGTDSSGLSNTWTANNFTTSGTGTDVMSDTPTTNFNTLNPAIRPYTATPAEVLSNGNLKLTCSSSSVSGSSWSTMLITSGKWYWEATLATAGASNTTVGWCNSTEDAGRGTHVADLRTNGVCYLGDNGEKVINTTKTSYGDSFTTGDVIGASLDADAGTVTFYKNGVSQGDITGQSPQSDSAGWLAAVEGFNGTVWDVNFGQRAFAYTPPTGFKPLNTSNLSAPTVKDGSKNFNTVLWTGNGSTQSITGVGFQPDFVWSKTRSPSGYGHWLGDVVRGGNERLASDSTQEGRTNEGNITFDTDGFSVTSTHPSLNNNTSPIVAWNWKAGGSGSSNTDGNVTSTVSANPTAGFSIVAYQSSTTTKPLNVGHGLGVKPSFILTKNRDLGASWGGYHSALGATKGIFINSTSAAVTSTDYWNNTEPTSTVFTVYDSNNTHSYGTTNNFIAYCFAEVEGYSKFGSYTGNGSSDGVFVHCGFSPRWIMWKETTVGESWYIHDTARTPHNVSTQMLRPNYSNAEATGDSVDILSNGFKLRSGGAGANYSGRVYIFAAFAEHPTGGSGVSPATAR